ncbi:MAG: hypothetical protein GTO45_19990, partial [Candidatus Aminicenantes bacterium]|nr:hypothetical protein [Candidatus Aminicenantes bacterium]NIM81075.1 hypothetical protein [Candidatus Aminicenantes bacterium]NIN20452.1 hypothetical protein [Candidatus Aminicenantes bacterium]NIN44225.1 hypothetical protein [Candidatus Aminicenantes bacterium]NIN87043.1 hypothetical protein [Candidatus Aminicenantes bacterium]
MLIKGMYRDILKRDASIIFDRGWQSNKIAADYGRFMAALMKKQFPLPVGVEYLAVGSGNEGEEVFKERVSTYFTRLNEEPGFSGPLFLGDNNQHWVWAKKIAEADVKYLNELGDISIDVVTNRLGFDVVFAQNEPSTDTLGFQEFALLGIHRNGDGVFDVTRMFLINYVSHGTI